MSLLLSLLVQDLDQVLLVHLISVLDKHDLDLVRDLVDIFALLCLELELSLSHHLLHEQGVGTLGALQVLLRLHFLSVPISDSLLDLFDLLLAMLTAVFLHRKLLFFFTSTGPDFNIICLLCLVLLKGVTILLKHLGIEGHNALVIELILRPL